MTHSWSVERKTLAGLIVALVTLAVMSFVAVRAIQARENSSARLSSAQQNLLTISQLHADISEVANVQDSYVATGIGDLLREKSNTVSRLRRLLQSSGTQFAAAAEQQQRFSQVQMLIEQALAQLDQALQQYESRGLSAYAGSPLRTAAQRTLYGINRELGAMVNSEETLITQVRVLDRRSARMLYVVQGLVLGLALIVLLWLAVHVRADLQARRQHDVLLREANAELEQRAQQLRLSNQELESFCYSVSHDLRAPLRTIDGFTRLVEEELQASLGPQPLRYLHAIRSASNRMSQLIDDLLMYSKLGRQAVRAAPLDMNALVSKAVELAAYGRAVQPAIVVAPLASVQGDESMLSCVWQNLIDNAIKYSSKQSHPKIEISCASDEQQVIYRVHDNGVGFDMKHYDQLFGVFKRLHGSDAFPGTGVGLAIVERIVSRHGGRVWAESAPDAGATFFFSIPNLLPRQLQAVA